MAGREVVLWPGGVTCGVIVQPLGVLVILLVVALNVPDGNVDPRVVVILVWEAVAGTLFNNVIGELAEVEAHMRVPGEQD